MNSIDLIRRLLGPMCMMTIVPIMWGLYTLMYWLTVDIELSAIMCLLFAVGYIWMFCAVYSYLTFDYDDDVRYDYNDIIEANKMD